MDFAYLSEGKLHLKLGDAEPRVIESKFGHNIRERAVQIQQRNAWKTKGTGAQFMRGGALWGQGSRDPSVMRMTIMGITRGLDASSLYYALQTDEISGIFCLREHGTEEQRLFHSSDYVISELSLGREQGELAFVIARGGGISSIGVMPAQGGVFHEVTQGDCTDASPRWHPSQRKILYQSAGLARDDSGYVHGAAPYTLMSVDLESGETAVIKEATNTDHLSPRVTADGSLYYIRRPYKDPLKRPNPFRVLLDILLMPFRLVWAVFQYLNFFSVIYSGRPLTSSGGARQREADMRRMMVWGNIIEASRTGSDQAGASDLVPRSWELVRKTTPERKLQSRVR